MRVVVTGVAGFLGSHLAWSLITQGHTVSGIDNLLSGDLDNVPTKLDQLVIEDCRNRLVLCELFRDVDVVVHCAAAAHEGLSVFSPVVITENTYNTTVAVGAAAAEMGVKRVVFTSSTARYGPSPFMPFVETHDTDPIDPYGIAKVAAEKTLLALSNVHGFEVVIAVPHNIIGPRQKYDDPFRNVASIMANRMLQGLPPIIYGDGKQTRSFSFVQDCVDPMVKMVTQSGLDGEVINIGPDDPPITILELATKLAKLTGYSGEFIFVPDRPQEVKHTWVSADKARTLLNYNPTTTLDAGLESIVEWIKYKNTKPFSYYLPLEIINDHMPKTWKDRLF